MGRCGGRLRPGLIPGVTGGSPGICYAEGMRSVVTTRLSVLLAGLVGLAACAAPPIDATLETDGVTLPERPASTGDSGTTSDAGTTLPSQPGQLTLTVTLSGSGAGAITSTPSGVTCKGTTCKGTFPRGTAVTLTAAPATGSVFVVWSSACTGSAACTATMDKDVAIGAELETIEGAWSGTYTNTRVASNCTFNNAGDLTATLKANGAAFASSETITGLELRNIPGCQLVGKTTGTAALADVTVAGNTITGTWTFAVQNASGTLAFPFTAKVMGKSMTGTWTCATCVGSFTLTRP